MYQLNTQSGYIVSIVKGVSHGNLTEEEYKEIKAVLSTQPTAPSGFVYRLKNDLTWEMYELPPVTDDEGDKPATANDYQAALAELGVTINDES